MATVLVHPIPFPLVPRMRPKNMVAPARCLISTAHQSMRFVGLWRHSCTMRSVAEESSSSSLDVGDDEVIPETAILPEGWSVKRNDPIGKRR
ncbi:hypothetical protein ACFX1S_041776 [Malus domestica]